MTDTTTTTIDGEYLEVDGRPALRFERTYPHPIAHVWRHLTDPDLSRGWFPSRLEIEPRTGGTITFTGDLNLGVSTGEVLAFDEPTELAFTWGDDEVRLELTALDDLSTRLLLTNVLGERAAAARNGAGWQVCLANLASSLGGGAGDVPHLEGTWDGFYEQYVAAGVPSGAHIPGRD